MGFARHRIVHDKTLHACITGVTHLYDKLPVLLNVLVCLLLFALCLRLKGDIYVHPQLLTAQTDGTRM